MRTFGKVLGILLATAAVCVVLLLYLRRNADPSAPPGLTAAASAITTQNVAASEPARAASDSSDLDPAEAEYQAKEKEWWKKIIKTLLERDDAESVAAAAILSGMPQLMSESPDSLRQKILARLARAAALAPTNPAIQSLAFEVCYGTPGCDPSAYESALRSIDPKNALAWIGAVERADRQKGDGGVAKAVADMAKAERFDLYWAANIGSTVHAVESVPIAPPDAPAPVHPATLHYVIAVAAIGTMGAYALPQLAPLTKACKSIESAATDCTQIGLAMERGDTFIAQGIGLSIEKSIVAPGSAEAARVAEAKRQFDWLMRAQSLTATSTSDPTQWLLLLDETRSEQSAMKAWLTQNGMPTEPPPNWKREDPN